MSLEHPKNSSTDHFYILFSENFVPLCNLKKKENFDSIFLYMLLHIKIKHVLHLRTVLSITLNGRSTLSILLSVSLNPSK